MILCLTTRETWSEINHREVTCSPHTYTPFRPWSQVHSQSIYMITKRQVFAMDQSVFSGCSKRLGKYWIKFWERWFAELMRNGDFPWYLPLSKKKWKKLWRHESNQSTQFLLQVIRQVKSLRLKFYWGNFPSSLNITTSKNGISH